MSKYDYVAIDFETANEQLTSACSIGIIAVKNDCIVKTCYHLINPNMPFNPYNTHIHGITEKDVEGEPRFNEIYSYIQQFFDGETVFAHSAGFDISVLKALIERYNLPTPNIKIGCTLKVAQKIWKDVLINCKLGTISAYLEVEHDYHNALSDAIICTEIIKRAKRARNVASEAELFEVLGLAFGTYNESLYKLPFSKLNHNPKITIDPKSKLKDKVVAFAGKPKAMTKKALVERLQINGCLVSKAIDRSVEFFIALQNCPKEKLKQANELKNITVVDEATFLGWLV